jgi:hypothetical protein
MVKREDFIGTMFESTDGRGRGVTCLITGIAGEGETGVAFIVTYVDRPSEQKWVMKVYKPLPWLEMNVLHSSFRINEELYPNHPLRMTPERRLELLKQEMIGRIKSPGTIYRVSMLKDMLVRMIDVLGPNFYDAYFDGTLADDFLESEPAIMVLADPILCERIDYYITEGNDVEKYADFFQFIKECVEERLDPSTHQLPYKTASTSALVLLWGLRSEGFLVENEFLAILEDAEFQSLIGNDDLWILLHVIRMLISQLRARADALPRLEGEEHDFEREQFSEDVDSIMKACDLLIRVSSAGAFCDDQVAGLANLWMANSISLGKPENATDERLTFLYRAIPLLEKANSLQDLCVVFEEVASLLYPRDKAAAETYVRRADELKEMLKDGGNEVA